MILVMVRIIITGFEEFSSGSGFWFLFQFMVLNKRTRGHRGNNRDYLVYQKSEEGINEWYEDTPKNQV